MRETKSARFLATLGVAYLVASFDEQLSSLNSFKMLKNTEVEKIAQCPFSHSQILRPAKVRLVLDEVIFVFSSL